MKIKPFVRWLLNNQPQNRVRLTADIEPEILTNPRFRCTALAAVQTADGRDLTHLDLAGSGSVWPSAGLTSFLDHRTGDPTLIGQRSAEDAIGVASRPNVEGQRLVCDYEFLPGDRSDRIRLVAEEIIRRRASGQPIPNIGLSPDATFLMSPEGHPQQVHQWHSLDVVYDPATGAGFEDLVRDAYAHRQQQPQVWDMRPRNDSPPPAPRSQDVPAAPQPDVEALRMRLAQLEQGAFIERHAGLMPENIQQTFSEWVTDRMRLAATLPTDEEARNYLATLQSRFPVSPVQGNRSPAAQAGPDGWVRLHLAAARLWGLDPTAYLTQRNVPVPQNVDQVMRDVEPLMGIRELYVLLTGDREGTGSPQMQRVQFATVNTTSFAYFVQDAINVVIQNMMSDTELDMAWYNPIVLFQETDSIDQVNWVRVDAFDAAPTVNEGAAYTELAWDDIEETATFGKKGGYLGITLESILTNRGGRIPALARGIATAALKAESGIVAATFTDAAGAGPTMTETGRALFNATEGNYGTTALSTNQFWVVSNAMAAFTEAGDTGYRLGRANRPNRMVIPTDLVATANTIINSTLRPEESGGATTGGNMQSINAVPSVHPGLAAVECPEFTDATDWYAIRHSPPMRPFIVLYHLRGRRRPQVFAQDGEQVGAMFTNDEMRYKVRHWVAKLVPNWRQGYGSVVAG